MDALREQVVLQVPNDGQPQLQIRFQRLADRYGHMVELRCADDLQRLLESAEGNQDNGWPLSPPLQQIHVHQRDDGRQFALLVGMSGREHWSMSVELEPDGQSLIFDVACKCASPKPDLRSTYRIIGDRQKDQPKKPNTEAVLIDPIRLDVLPIPGFGNSSIIQDSDSLIIVPRVTDAQTHRWKYRISIPQ